MISENLLADSDDGFPADRTGHWARFGFRADPYYGLHLPVDRGSADLLVGREEDRVRLRGFLSAYPTGKTMIQGAAGVGKTSLVNVVQWELYSTARRFPLFDIVETAADATRESFLLAVLSGVISSLRHVYSDEDLAGDEAYRHAQDAVTQTLRHAASLNLTATLPPIASVGAARTPVSRAPLAVTSQPLVDLLRALVASIQHRGFEGLIVPVNNLDTLDTDSIILFLNAVRDVCGMVDGIHWIFIGGPHLFDILETRARRISESFTSNPVSLMPLTWEEVSQALERRRQSFALTPDVQLPISSTVSRIVYEAGQGELRFLFARLSRTVLEYAVRYPSERTVPDDLALEILSVWARGQLARHRLTPKEDEVLRYMQTSGAVRPRDHAAMGFRTHQQLSSLLQSLIAKEYVMLSDGTDGNVYSPTAAATLLHARQLNTAQ